MAMGKRHANTWRWSGMSNEQGWSIMHVLSTLGVKGVLDVLLPRFEAATGVSVTTVFNPTAVLVRDIMDGTRADVALLTSTSIDEQIAKGVLMAATRQDLARSKVGFAVRSGAPQPDISTPDAVKASLLNAHSVVYSKAGASGIFFAGLLQRLGIADAINAKATVIPAGFTGEYVADGRADLAVQQISELMVVPGIDIVGALPPGAQDDLIFSGGIFAGSTDPGMAASFLAYISSPDTEALYAEKGLYPVD